MEYGIGGGDQQQQQQEQEDGYANSNSNSDLPNKAAGKKKYHRHTANQIQRLEAMFKECQHPDEKARLQLSRELNLAPRQIKFWFQNRRTQIKGQLERADNCGLRAENDRIRCENITIREALKNVICPSCGGPPPVTEEESYFDEQKLRMENAQLKQHLDRVSSIASKYIGRPISHLPPVQPIHISSLDLSMSSSFGPQPSSLDLDLLLPGAGVGSSSISLLPFHHLNISDMDKSVMADIAATAMNELIKLLQTNDPLWMKSATAPGGDILQSYARLFHRPNTFFNNPNVHVEVSRHSADVIMNALALVDMFMDANKWVALFPTIVSTAKTIQVISSGILGSQSGTLQLMYEELQVLSPFVPKRQIYFMRLCQQMDQGSWVIADVSYDMMIPGQENHCPSPCKVFRYPSGCWIQDMPNGYSKVTWLEHSEVEEKLPVHRLFKDVIHSGLAFGAERWLASLQRTCERFACMMGTSNSTHDLGGVIPSPEGKRSMRKLAERMVSSFCSSINYSANANGQQWTSVNNDLEVRATIQKTTDPGQPNGVVLSAATTIWLPIPPQSVFNFLRDERTRHQWDVVSNQNPFEEVAHIANGSHQGNCISLLRALNTSQNNMLVLQESFIDSSGALVVYCPVDLPAINIAMSGEDPAYIPLLPSGFTITPDGHHNNHLGLGRGDTTTTHHHAGSSSSSTTSTTLLSNGGGPINYIGGGGAGGGGGGGGGSLVTVVLQILVHSMASSAKMSGESVNTVNNLINNTVQQIKGALNC